MIPASSSNGRSLLITDAAVLLGATNNDPGVGFTAGFTYVFNAFQVP